MAQDSQIFHTSQRNNRSFNPGDLAALVFIIVFLYIGLRLAFNSPAVIVGPEISLAPSALPWYLLLSTSRMTAAYLLSIVFTLLYGRAAARSRRAERFLMPLLDVLQSVPILSFLPVVLLGLTAFLPENVAAELASIVLIFTSQAWNLTFAWYQSLTSLPKELGEASAIFKLNPWMKFKTLELPFGMTGLVWNSMMSWAGGWFFLIAAEIFTVGSRDFRLPGIGAYLHQAAYESDYTALAWGLAALTLTIVALDQLVWRPLIAWSERYKMEMVESDNPPSSWFYDLMHNAGSLRWLQRRLIEPAAESFDRAIIRRRPVGPENEAVSPARGGITAVVWIAAAAAGAYGLFRAAQMLAAVPPEQWQQVGLGIAATFLRVLAATLLAMAWTIPAGVAIGTNRRLAAVFQPLVQITASIPATALFPVILIFALGMPGGLNLAAILLMLVGTQWYLLFNIIAGASAIPQDLKYTSELMGLSGRERWRTLILPAIFPFLVTGAITASGGAWNASIVAEYQTFGGQVISVTGIGSLIAEATGSGDYALLLAATLGMILTVILINRLVWRRLYRLAEEKYRME